MTQYEVLTNDLGTEVIKKIDNEGVIWFIPKDASNLDYQEYLKWKGGN